MKVDVFSREKVRRLTPDPNVCLVSIWSCITLAKGNYKDELPMEGWFDVLKLEFDDVTHGASHMGFEVVPFDKFHATMTLDFIEKNKGKDFVVHCDAGVSRSVAVGSFMEMIYGYNPTYHEIGNDQFRNILVLNTLRREWMKRNGQEI